MTKRYTVYDCERTSNQMALRLSPRRFAAGVSTLLALYSLARVSVLFFEALAIVRDSRYEDQELLDLCVRGEARGSAKMRDACLKARAELASPVVFKAIVYAVSTAFKDFSDTVGSPFKLSLMVVFIIGSVALPVMPWLRLFLGQHVPEAPQFSGAHYISYAPPPDPRSRFRKRVGRAIKALKLRSSPAIEDAETYDRFEELEPGEDKSVYGTYGGLGAGASDGTNGANGSTWTSIDIGGMRPASPSSHTKWE